jgi:hypothetical protein
MKSGISESTKKSKCSKTTKTALPVVVQDLGSKPARVTSYAAGGKPGQASANRQGSPGRPVRPQTGENKHLVRDLGIETTSKFKCRPQSRTIWSMARWEASTPFRCRARQKRNPLFLHLPSVITSAVVKLTERARHTG